MTRDAGHRLRPGIKAPQGLTAGFSLPSLRIFHNNIIGAAGGKAGEEKHG
jgi:hypothetical protein